MASYLDSFNRTNANLESSLTASGGWNWVHDGAIAAALSIVSNQLQCNTFADPGTAFKTPALASADHYAQFKVVDITAAPGPFVCCRLTDKNNFIGFRVSNSGGNGSIQIFVNNANSYTSKYASGAGACANGDIIRLEVSDTTYVLRKNGTIVTSGSIGTLTASSNAGLVGRVAAPAPWIDDFEAGDLPIRHQGTPTEAAATSVTLPTHAAGDTIFVFAYSESNVSVTLPAGWTQVSARTGSGGSFRCGWLLAASSAEVSGTWTNATSVMAFVLRGLDPVNPIGNATPVQGGTSSTTANYPALSPLSDGPSRVIGIGAHRSTDTAIDTAPAGMFKWASFIDANSELALHDTGTDPASWPSTNVTLGGTLSDWRTLAFEVLGKRTVTAPTAGAIAITGTAAGVKVGRVVAAAAGAITIAGTDAAITKSGAAAKVVTAGVGAISIAGQSAAITAAKRVVAAAGAISVAGVNAGLLMARKVIAGVGAIAVSGSTAGILRARRATAAAGAIVIAGQDASITKAAATAKVLVAGVGAIVISGTDAAVTYAGGQVTPPSNRDPGGPEGRRQRIIYLHVEEKLEKRGVKLAKRKIAVRKKRKSFAKEVAEEVADAFGIPEAADEIYREIAPQTVGIFTSDEQDNTERLQAALQAVISAAEEVAHEIRAEEEEDDEILLMTG